MLGFNDIAKDAENKANLERELELWTPAELISEWASAVEGDLDRPLTTCIPSFDRDLRNKLRGTVGAYIGYGGSKKSLIALQSLRQNVISHKNNCTGIYSNMEMAVFQMMSRLIDMSFEIENYKFNVSQEYERAYSEFYKEKNEVGKKEIKDVLVKYFDQLYGKNLYINSQSGMRVEDFDRLIKTAKKKNGVIDMLVIDGLSMMSGSGSETEQYTTNSKELKDLAKHHNIYIPLICHLSKGAEKHTRDIQRFIRGSEKILDNVDFVIQMSLIIDQFRTDEYERDRGYSRLFNKRGSGNTVNIIYHFDSAKLLITESQDEPSTVEVRETKSKKSVFL